MEGAPIQPDDVNAEGAGRCLGKAHISVSTRRKAIEAGHSTIAHVRKHPSAQWSEGSKYFPIHQLRPATRPLRLCARGSGGVDSCAVVATHLENM